MVSQVRYFTSIIKDVGAMMCVNHFVKENINDLYTNQNNKVSVAKLLNDHSLLKVHNY
jgi:hypothetical protein